MDKKDRGKTICASIIFILAGIAVMIYGGRKCLAIFQEPTDIYEADWDGNHIDKLHITGSINTRDIGVKTSGGRSGGMYTYLIPIYAKDASGNEYIEKFVGVQISAKKRFDMDNVYSSHEVVTDSTPTYEVDGTVSLMRDSVRDMFLNRLTIDYGLSYSDANNLLAQYVVNDTEAWILILLSAVGAVAAICGVIGLIVAGRNKI